MTTFDGLALGCFLIVVSVWLVACRRVWRETRRLRAENKVLRAQYEIVGNAFKAVAQDWAALISSEEQHGIHNRPVLPNREERRAANGKGILAES